MDGWWKKNPFFVEYMVHEGTALFVAAYAITLLVGLVRLGQGPEAWAGWLGAMQSPLVKAVLDAFPKAKITDIRQPADAQSEAAFAALPEVGADDEDWDPFEE